MDTALFAFGMLALRDQVSYESLIKMLMLPVQTNAHANNLVSPDKSDFALMHLASMSITFGTLAAALCAYAAETLMLTY